jgi:hypothetical protein
MTRFDKVGAADSDWIRGLINEAQRDPVGFWHIVRIGRENFGLTGTVLEDFVRNFIIELVKSGAEPIMGDKQAAYGWGPFLQYGSDPENIADGLISDWKNAGVDPDVGGVWFAFPDVWK